MNRSPNAAIYRPAGELTTSGWSAYPAVRYAAVGAAGVALGFLLYALLKK